VLKVGEKNVQKKFSYPAIGTSVPPIERIKFPSFRHFPLDQRGKSYTLIRKPFAISRNVLQLYHTPAQLMPFQYFANRYPPGGGRELHLSAATAYHDPVHPILVRRAASTRVFYLEPRTVNLEPSL
jgi:hypothetical protein